MDVFDLSAKLTLDSSQYERALHEAGDGVDGMSSKWSKFGKLLKVGVAAIGATSVAIGGLAKKSVEAYAEYEQLAGGVKKLYGDASDELMKYANNAYKTAGMSANQYMEQATSFSAALINSLGGDQSKAAKQTDVAMRAISDNFNTFGGDITNVQNAFQGFAKQNYTMLDNLKLGYGGTKTEMQRLIDDANEYAKSMGMAGDLSMDSFSDIVTAIDLIQQKQGIAGTTAKEAATTIEGSLNMTKGAWENLMAGFANPDADLGKLMDNLVVAIVGEGEGEGLLNQILPAIQRAVDGIGQLLTQAAPILAEQLPPIVESLLPPLITAATTLVGGLVGALPSILQALFSVMPTVITGLVNALVQSLPLLAAAAPQIILTLVQGITASLPTLVPAMVSAVIQMATALLENVDVLAEAAVTLVGGIALGIIRGLPKLIAAVPKLIKALVSGIGKSGGRIGQAGVTLMKNLASGIGKGISSIPRKVISLARRIPSAIKSGIGNLASIGRNLIEGLWGGIKSKFDGVINRVKALASKLPKAVKKVLGIASPSKVFKQIGENVTQGLAIGIEDGVKLVDKASDKMMGAFSVTADTGNVIGGGNAFYNTISVSGAENPEDFASRFIRQMELEARAL